MSERITSLGTEVQPKNIMSEEERTKSQTNALEIMRRNEEAQEELAAQKIILDASNKVSFPGFPYVFEAIGEKILVSIDIFKTGYECKVCAGKKRIKYICICETRGHPGTKYALDSDRPNILCPNCKGDYEAARTNTPCPACKGQGAILVLPETSKSLPTSGVIVSRGRECKRVGPQGGSREQYEALIGDRILFGPYAGSMIPTKAGILFKILDDSNAWLRVEGADNLGAFDFVLQDTNE